MSSQTFVEKYSTVQHWGWECHRAEGRVVFLVTWAVREKIGRIVVILRDRSVACGLLSPKVVVSVLGRKKHRDRLVLLRRGWYRVSLVREVDLKHEDL